MIRISEIEPSLRMVAENLTHEQIIDRWINAEIVLEYARQERDKAEAELKDRRGW